MNAPAERDPFAPLVVGVDGFEPSLRAVDWAADEAALREVPLRVVYACTWKRYESAALAGDIGRPTALPPAQDVVRAAAERARDRHPGLRVTADLVFGDPEHALVREGRHASALVTGTRGRGGVAELLRGSVSRSVAAHADCPVIVLRGSHDNQATPPVRGRVVVGVGGEPKGSAVVRFAVEEARRRGVPLEAVRAWQCPARESTDLATAAGEPARLHEERAAGELDTALLDVPADVTVRRRTVEGDIRRVLMDASHEGDLLVVGTRQSEGRFGPRLGRVAHAALHHSACPVAVVPHPAQEA
ncbi:universal stress protein [Streptomyces sp. NPDC006624]|uniref:universal stress protein n=1 Tax=unclassified Streptomyces TaxID=2593676 RepID=UPI0033B80936